MPRCYACDLPLDRMHYLAYISPGRSIVLTTGSRDRLLSPRCALLSLACGARAAIFAIRIQSKAGIRQRRQ